MFEREQFTKFKGIPLIVPTGDETYTLLHPEAFPDFWRKVSKNQDAELEGISLSEDGGFYYYLFSLHNQQKSYVYANLGWDQLNEPQVRDMKKIGINDWSYTEKGNFIYNLSTPHAEELEENQMIRIKPVDSKLLQYSLSYIEPIGYQGNNLFITDWNEKDFSKINFNDLFDYLAEIKTGTYLNVDSYPYDSHTSNLYIPKDEFEETITKFFKISSPSLERMASYDVSHHAYPWRELSCSNCYTNPPMSPDVTDCKTNKDGTITLTVDVICTKKSTDKLFTHKVTLRPLSNHDFQYVSNQVINKTELPIYFPRITEQRPKEYQDY